MKKEVLADNEPMRYAESRMLPSNNVKDESGLNKLIEELKKNPLFYLFLSSRELFHSNFWYWLSTVNKEQTYRLFSDQDYSKDVEFFREYGQVSPVVGDATEKYKARIDLLAAWKSKGRKGKDLYTPVLVVENKIKDFPTKEQLDRIKHSVGNIANEEAPKFVLVTLAHYGEMQFDGWRVLTYKRLADKIEARKFFPSAANEKSYFFQLISGYKKLIEDLSSLAETLTCTDSYDFALDFNKSRKITGKALFELLNEVRLWEWYQKLRASHFMYELKSRYPEFKKGEYKTEVSVNRKKATITIGLKLKYGYEIGIQIENKQFRKYLLDNSAPPRSVPESRTNMLEPIAEKLRSGEIPIHFNQNFQHKRNQSPYCRYYKVFLYQYYVIGQPVSYDDLFERIKEILQGLEGDKSQIESIIEQVINHKVSKKHTE